MNLEELLSKMETEGVIHGGSDVNKAMVAVSSETRRLCAQLNNGVYTSEEIRQQVSEIIGQELDEGFSLFVPFISDFGKNIKIGQMYSLMLDVSSRTKGKSSLETKA